MTLEELQNLNSQRELERVQRIKFPNILLINQLCKSKVVHVRSGACKFLFLLLATSVVNMEKKKQTFFPVK